MQVKRFLAALVLVIMAFNAKKFCNSPSLDQLQQPVKKDDWRYIAQYFDVTFPSSVTKEVLKSMVVEKLVKDNLLPVEAMELLASASYAVPLSDTSDHGENVSEQGENYSKNEWTRAHFELEKRKVELQFELEFAKLKLEEKKLGKEVKVDPSFNLAKNIALVPEFNEVDPEGSFNTFEKLALHFNWPRSEWTYLLQSKLTGKAAIVFSNLDCIDDYEQVKQFILTAFSITPDGYRQKFRSLVKTPQVTYVEFITENLRLFNKWISSSNVGGFDELRTLMVMEEFKRKLPFDLRIHIEEKSETDLIKAAQIADSFSLLRKSQTVVDGSFIKQCKSQSSPDVNNPYCSYCKQHGHHISQCKNHNCKKSGFVKQ